MKRPQKSILSIRSILLFNFKAPVINYKGLLYLFLLLGCFILSTQTVYSQDSWWKNKKYKSKDKQQKYDQCKSVFVGIGDGLMYSNVTYISPFFQNEVYLSINNSEKGYYNREQTIYIVESFLSSNPVSSFKWKNSTTAENYAFAIGKYKYKKSGFINTYTISVSLKYINNLWLIDQVIVN